MTKPTGSGYLRSHARAKNLASPKRQSAESSMDRLINAEIAKVVVRDADQGQAFRDAQAKSPREAGSLT